MHDRRELRCGYLACQCTTGDLQHPGIFHRFSCKRQASVTEHGVPTQLEARDLGAASAH